MSDWPRRTCLGCGTVLTRKRHEQPSRFLRRRYCGYTCMGRGRMRHLDPLNTLPGERHPGWRPPGDVDDPAEVIEAKLEALARERRKHPVYTLTDVPWSFAHRYTGGID